MARLLCTLASAGAVALCVATGSPALSSSPRGWNSWYNFLGASDENATLAAAQYLVTSGLSNLGYTTVTIDEGWSEDSNGIIIDGYGRLTWNQQMYPNGLPWLAQQLHGMGLKLGLWIVRGEHAQLQFQARHSRSNWSPAPASTSHGQFAVMALAMRSR